MTLPSDDRLCAIVEFLSRCGGRDGAGGGVSPRYLATGPLSDHSRRALDEQLQHLKKQGKVVQVQGLGPNGPRIGYLPADHDDAPDQTEDQPRRQFVG